MHSVVTPTRKSIHMSTFDTHSSRAYSSEIHSSRVMTLGMDQLLCDTLLQMFLSMQKDGQTEEMSNDSSAGQHWETIALGFFSNEFVGYPDLFNGWVEKLGFQSSHGSFTSTSRANVPDLQCISPTLGKIKDVPKSKSTHPGHDRSDFLKQVMMILPASWGQSACTFKLQQVTVPNVLNLE